MDSPLKEVEEIENVWCETGKTDLSHKMILRRVRVNLSLHPALVSMA
jgi:hypothetical protein